MKIKITIQLFASLLVWFAIFYTISKVTGAEWLVTGKYYLTAIIMSFFIGVHTGIWLLKRAVTK